MAWTTPQHVGSGVADSAQFNVEVIDNLQHLFDELLAGWQDYVPAHTAITVGNGSQIARFVKLGTLVVVSWTLSLGSTSSIGTGARLGLPVAAANSDAQASIRYTDASASSHFSGLGTIVGGSASMALLTAAGNPLTATAPFTWNTNDVLRVTLPYEVA